MGPSKDGSPGRCSESAGAHPSHAPGASVGHRQERSWLEMLAAEDDVEGQLLRAPDTTDGLHAADSPPLGSLFDDLEAYVMHPPVHSHGGVTRGVISQLRRSATDVGGALFQQRTTDEQHPHEHPSRRGGRNINGVTNNRRPVRGGGKHARGRHSPLGGGPNDTSLVDRLRETLDSDPPDAEWRGGRGAVLRRARTLPNNLHDAAFDSDVFDPDAFEDHTAATRAAEAAAQAASPRPFGFLGVTRPPWTTRWEANLVDVDTGERVFLGNFDQKESAARAHDAAKLKLFGDTHGTVPPDELNFDAGDYHDELVAMTECTFEEFVRTLVTHSYGGAARAGHSKFRGVFAREDGRWDAKLDAEDAGVAGGDRRWKK